MTSEIRANTLKNRVGLGTVSFTNTGPVVSGIVTIANSTSEGVRLEDNAGIGNSLKITTPTGYVSIGAGNATFVHLSTDRGIFYFNKRISVDEGIISSYDEDLILQSPMNTNRVTINKTTGLVSIVNDLDVDGHTNLDNVSVAGVSTVTTFLQVLGQAGTSDKGLEVRADSTQSTDTNKAIRIRNNSNTDTFNVSYKGLVNATSFVGSGANLTGVLKNVVEDTSPQLGGDLDTNGFNINFDDTKVAYFGNSNDFMIYHSGTHSYIKNKTNNLYIMTTNTEYGALLYANGGVELRYDNVEKFITTSTGIKLSSGVSGSVSNILQLDHNGNNNGDGSKITFSRAGTIRTEIESLKNETSNNETDIIFRTTAAGSLGEKVRIASTGNVSIGTQNITEGKLQVNGDITAGIQHGSSGIYGMLAGRKFDGTSALGGYAIRYGSGYESPWIVGYNAGSGYDNQITFGSMTTSDRSLATGVTKRMVIDMYDGNVGISSASPVEKFDVAGSINAGGENAPVLKIHNEQGNRVTSFKHYFDVSKGASSGSAANRTIVAITMNENFHQALFEVTYGTRLQAVYDQKTRPNKVIFGVNRFNGASSVDVTKTVVEQHSEAASHCDVNIVSISATVYHVRFEFSTTPHVSSAAGGWVDGCTVLGATFHDVNVYYGVRD